LQAVINAGQSAFNAASVGKRCELLLERKGKLPGQLIGKSPWLQSVHIVGDFHIGDIITVDTVAAGPNSLTGALVEKELHVA
jgi:tRNA-2-methylthio-N6-dimethylallyladenosine synthase